MNFKQCRFEQLLLLLFFALMISACGENVEYRSSMMPENGQWVYEEPLAAEFEISDTQAVYDLYLDIDHATSYSFQNIYMLIETTFPDGSNIQDQLNVDMCDPAGNWYGKCRGDACRLRVFLSPGIRFADVGRHSIKFFQHTRQESLSGISSLAFLLSKQDPG